MSSLLLPRHTRFVFRVFEHDVVTNHILGCQGVREACPEERKTRKPCKGRGAAVSIIMQNGVELI
jgi:hypothetical protein